MTTEEFNELINSLREIGLRAIIFNEDKEEMANINTEIANLDEMMKSAEKAKGKKSAPELVQEGTKIIIPKGMTFDDAIKWMMVKKDESERKVNVFAEFSGAFPLDALVAFKLAIDEQFGWHSTATEMNPWTGEEYAKATMITIPTGVNETMEAPFGEFALPGIDGALATSISWQGTPSLCLQGSVKNKDVATFQELVARTRAVLKQRSIYKGKAVRISFEYMRDSNFPRNFNPIQHAPSFMDLFGVSAEQLIFSRDIMHSLELGLFAPIEKSSTCRALNIPLKRGVLLEGPPGVGKSLTSLVTALKASQRGWTFIYLSSALDLERGLEFAKNYQPAVLFLEDIDKVMDSGDRDVRFRAILNLLDGIDSKGSEIITVFTTNFVEKLDPVILRPGRLDTVVSLEAPDEVAAEQLVELYGGESLSGEMNYDQIGAALKGKIPAVIREVVERAKLATIARTPDGDVLPLVTTEDIIRTARLMENHMKLLEPKAKEAKEAFMLVVNGTAETARNYVGSNGIAKAANE